VSVLIASLAVPLVFVIARIVLCDAKAAVGCAALVAVMPGFALDVARAGNDSLGIVFFSALILFGLQGPADKTKWALGMGILLGLGLLTKAYFLTAPVALILVFRRRAIAPVVLGGVIGGWWYLRNTLTGTFAGLNDANSIQRVSPGEMLHRALGIPWLKAADTILFSHIYFGGWSSLSVRSWMYHLFYAVILLGAVGAILLWRGKPIQWLWFNYGLFWLGLFYFSLVEYVTYNRGGSPGWYMYAVVAAEVTLCTAGLYRILPRWVHQWVLPGGVFLFAALDLYTMHALAIPYYTGMIRHRAGGTLAALHLADFQSVGFHEAFLRLGMFKPVLLSAPVMISLWLGYVLATIGLIAVVTGRRRKVD
jgi:4-amino-4-deoxy-L-arabinose transferase-like glycosyltransferase